MGAGALTNHAHISGQTDGVIFAGSGTLANYGSISGSTLSALSGFYGVDLLAGGTVINHGLIRGSIGAEITSGVLVNAGTIAGVGGAAGYAAIFNGMNNRLVIDATGRFVGSIKAASSTGNVLELATTAGHAGGALNGLGTTIAGFDAVVVDTRGTWTLNGPNTTSSASISVAAAGLLTIAGQLTNAGTLTIAPAGTTGVGTIAVTGLLSTSSLQMSGGIDLDISGAGEAVVGAGGTGQAGAVIVSNSGVLSGVGKIVGNVINSGSIKSYVAIATRLNVLDVTGDLSGAGMVSLGSHTTLQVDGNLTAAGVSFMAGGDERLSLGAPGTCTSVISGFGFAKTDIIDLLGALATGEMFSGGVLTVTGAGGGTLASLHFAGSYQTSNFVLASDGHGGTAISFSAATSLESAARPIRVAPADAFISAMAGLSGAVAAQEHQTPDIRRLPAELLSRPHAGLT
jgi:hypothetical protein